MKNLHLIIVIVFTGLAVLSCETTELDAVDRETSEEDGDVIPTEEDDPVSGSQEQEALMLVPCGCDEGVCEQMCLGYDSNAFSALTTIRDRPCEFPAGCFPDAIPFKDFRVQVRSEFVNLTKVRILTENYEIVASSEEELGGSLKLDKEKGIIYVDLALKNEKLLSQSLIMLGQTGVLDDNNEVQLAKFEHKMGDNFFEQQ